MYFFSCLMEGSIEFSIRKFPRKFNQPRFPHIRSSRKNIILIRPFHNASFDIHGAFARNTRVSVIYDNYYAFMYACTITTRD